MKTLTPRERIDLANDRIANRNAMGTTYTPAELPRIECPCCHAKLVDSQPVIRCPCCGYTANRST